MWGGGEGYGGTPDYSNPISLLQVVQLLSCSYVDFLGRSECGELYSVLHYLQRTVEWNGGQRTIFQRLVLVYCPHSANTPWILSPWVVCSVFSLGVVPSVCSPFHGHVFPSSVVSMVFVVAKQLSVAPCSLCAISFLWCSSSNASLPPPVSGFESLHNGSAERLP